MSTVGPAGTAILVVRLVRHRPSPAAALALLAAALTFLLTGIALGAAQIERADLDGVRGRSADYAFVVQPATSPVPAGLPPALHPVQDTTGEARSGDRAVAADARFYGDQRSMPGRLVGGRLPRSPGESVLSVRAGAVLAADPGATVTYTASEPARTVQARVVGTVVDTGNRDAVALAVLLLPGEVAPTGWLTDTDPYTDPALRPLLDARTLSYRTVDQLAAESFANSPRASVRQAATVSLPGLVVLGALLLGVLLRVMSREAAPTVRALSAAGFPIRTGWRIHLVAAGVVITVGAALGVVAATAAMSRWRLALSGRVNEYWTGAGPPVSAIAAAVAVVVLAFAVLAATAVRWHNAPAWSRRPVSGRATLALAATGVVLFVLVYLQVLYVTWTIPAALVSLAAAVLAIQWCTVARLDAGVRPLVTATAPGIAVLALASILLTAAAGLYSAATQNDADLATGHGLQRQPNGSVLVLGATEPARLAIQQTYERLGGRRSTWLRTPGETTSNLRVTNPRLVECLGRQPGAEVAQVLESCGSPTAAAPVNTVLLTADDDGPSAAVRADPSLIENGQVGLLRFDTPTGRITAQDIVPAVPDPNLGGNEPGAVTALHSPLAARYDLTPSGTGLLSLLDADALDPSAQGQLRLAIVGFAPAAQVATDDRPDDGGSHGISVLVACAGAAGALLLLATGSWSLLAAQAGLRQTLAEIGVAAARRRRLSLRIFAVPVAGNAASLLVVLLASWLLGAHQFASAWLWTAPATAAVLAATIGLLAYARAPGLHATD